MTSSKHYIEDRKSRQSLISEIGLGKIVKGFVVDKGHRNGPELHIVTTTGLILIHNYNTKKLITRLIARPGQLERYFGKGNTPKELIAIAIEHTRNGYNEI